jgi:hypothetical protein
VDFVDIADFKAEALCSGPQPGVQRMRAATGPDVHAHAKTAPGGLLTALRSAM